MADQNGSTIGQLLRREREKKKQSIQNAHAADKDRHLGSCEC